MLTFASCKDGEENGSERDLSSQESVTESIDESAFDVDDAIRLVELDKTVIDMFINNSLCDDKSVESVAVTSGEYVNFDAVESLLDSVYIANGNNKETFLAYPEGHTPSVSNVDGKTFVFNHIGSKYDDFIVTSSVTVSETENENEMIITAKTESGKDVELKAVCENENWLLESSLYLVNKVETSKTDSKFPLSDYGSFMKFSGKVLVIELFVSDSASGFTSVEEKEYHSRIEKAFNYITEQAETYGKEVTVDYKSTYFEHFGTIGPNVIDFDIVFAETGFGTLQKFADANCDLAAYDNYVFVVCMDKDIKATFSCYDGSDRTQIYFAERAVIGRNSTDVEICVSVLRLLGAYGFDEGICDEYTESLYNAYFPYDIMVSGSLTFSKMSPVTAFACGITDELDPLYRVFFYE
ncbi:MAG: hypothetical protein IJC20_00900 [Clostridia bacterium]|nr:hypothetical protein [Clostridia bacterium]